MALPKQKKMAEIWQYDPTTQTTSQNKTKMEISSNFEAFSEYLNFILWGRGVDGFQNWMEWAKLSAKQWPVLMSLNKSAHLWGLLFVQFGRGGT